MSSGTLRVFEDESGLRYECDPPDRQDAKDLVVSLQRGDVRESSFAFRIAENGCEWVEGPETDPIPTRTITKFQDLYDVSPVTYPAYSGATAGLLARSAEICFSEYEKIKENTRFERERARRARALEIARMQ